MNRRHFVTTMGLLAGLGAYGRWLHTMATQRFTRLWGDGLHDDTVALRERIAAAAHGAPGRYRMTHTGLEYKRGNDMERVVHVPAGTYYVPRWSIGELGQNPVHVQGAGVRDTIFRGLASERTGE